MFLIRGWNGLKLSDAANDMKSLLNGDSMGGWLLPLLIYNPPGILPDPLQCLPNPRGGPGAGHYRVPHVQLWVQNGTELPIEAGGSSLVARDNVALNKGELQVLFDQSKSYPESDIITDWPVIAINRIVGKSGDVQAFCVTQDGTAKKGEDFMFIQQQFRWRDQEEGVKQMRIQIIDDDEFEFEEYFTVHCECQTASVPISREDSRVHILGPNDGMETMFV